jgi:glycosyltransferase involved in cell wall biosynthesis
MIDIIIPAYNCSNTLGRTLSSLVAQTDTDFNVIIVDDCSTENLEPIIEDFKNSLNIKYIRNDVNIGAGMSRQVGMDNSLSKFIVFLDSDDMFMPYAIETFNSASKANPNIEFLQTYFYEQMYIDGEPVLALQKDNFTALHGKLYNMDIIRKYNIKFYPGMIWAEDAYFNAVCTELMSITLLKIPTMMWVYNNGSLLRSINPERDATATESLIRAMVLASDFVKQYKDSVCYIANTAKKLLQNPNLSESNKKELNKLLKEDNDNVL